MSTTFEKLDCRYKNIANQQKLLDLEKQKWQKAKFLEWQKEAFETRRKFLRWVEDIQYHSLNDSWIQNKFSSTIWKFNMKQTNSMLFIDKIGRAHV